MEDLYAPPAEEMKVARAVVPTFEAGPPLLELSAARTGKVEERWLIVVYADHLTFGPPGGPVIKIPRAQIGERSLVVPLGDDVVLTLTPDKINLKIDRYSADSLRSALASDLQQWAAGMSSKETQRALWIGLVAGVVWFLDGGSLFLGVLAIAYLIAGVGRYIRPGRWLFLLAGLRSVALLAVVVIDIAFFDARWWLALVALAFLLGASVSFRRYAFFRPSV